MTLEQLKELFPKASEETWHLHPNGGGWVQNTVTIDESAYVGPESIVYGQSHVVRENGYYWFFPSQYGGFRRPLNEEFGQKHPQLKAIKESI